jgi:hypothetical protein
MTCAPPAWAQVFKVAGLIWVSPKRIQITPIPGSSLSPPSPGRATGITLLIVILPRTGAKEKTAAAAGARAQRVYGCA